MSKDDPSAVGQPVFIVSDIAPIQAASRLGKALPRSHWMRSGGSPLRAGEHIAAILIDSFLNCGPPSSADTEGGVDLEFSAIASPTLGIPCGIPIAFEIKSLAGSAERRSESEPKFIDFRHWNSELDKAIAAGADLSDIRELSGVAVSIEDVVDAAKKEIDGAIESLTKKASAGTSRNVILLVHPFNYFAIESGEAVVTHLLPDPQEDEIDSLWLYVHHGPVAVWSTQDRTWTSLHYAVSGTLADDPDPIQQAETELVTTLGLDLGESPWSATIEFRP